MQPEKDNTPLGTPGAIGLRPPSTARARIPVPAHRPSLSLSRCVQCGARGSKRRRFVVDGRYRYRALVGTIGVVSSWTGPVLAVIVPMLTFMRRMSRVRASIEAPLCDPCARALEKREQRNRLLEGIASLVPLGAAIAGGVMGSIAWLWALPILGALATVGLVSLIDRRGNEERIKLVAQQGNDLILDVPASWRTALDNEPEPQDVERRARDAAAS